MEEKSGDVTNSNADSPATKTADTRASSANSQSEPGQTGALNDMADLQWQNRLLPWMVRMVVGLTAFFFIASLVQLFYLHWEIRTAPVLDPKLHKTMLEDLRHSVETSSAASSTPASAEHKLTAAVVAVLSSLETNAIARRYHQANVSLMSRVWTRYLGFVTGVVLAMVGAIFILGKLQVPESEAEVKSGTLAMHLRTTSPGLILAGLGTALMIITIVTHHEINVQDRPLYLQGWQMTTTPPDRSSSQQAADNAKEHAPPLKVRDADQEGNAMDTTKGAPPPHFLEGLHKSMDQPKETDSAAGITR